MRLVEEGALAQIPGGQPDVLLNPTALALWELCDGETAVVEMVAAVCILFDVNVDTANRDVTAALQDMLDRGVLSA